MDEFKANKLFDGIRCFTDATGKYTAFWSRLQPCMQFCVNCESVFSGVWGIKNNCGFGAFAGDYYTCPYCGYRHNKRSQHVLTLDSAAEQAKPIPYDIELKRVNRKDKLDLEVHSKCVIMRTTPADSYVIRRKELIRFDFRQGKTYYLLFNGQKIIERIELSPFKSVKRDALETIKDTAINYLNDESCIHGSLRRELDSFIKDFRKEFEKIFFKYKTHSTYIPTRVDYNLGAITNPLNNLVWRLACPDAPNIKSFKAALSPVRLNAIKRVMYLCSRGDSYISAVREVFSLPHWRSLTPIIAKHDISQLFELCFVLNFYSTPEYGKEIAELNLDHYVYRTVSSDRHILFLNDVKSAKGEKWMHETIKELCRGGRNANDMSWMYGQLSRRNKKILWDKKLRRRDLHDAIMTIYNKQKQENIVFDYEDKSRNLCGSLGGLQFLLPPDSDNLLELGKRMKNCIGSYRDRVATGEVDIVAAFNCDMRPIICIEIDNGEIVQAKLDCNKKVKEKAELNQLIIDYASKKNLIINTRDVRR